MTSIQHGAEYFARAVSRDQAGGAFGSAAVLRPAGSPLMPLRRMSHHPDLAMCLMRIERVHPWREVVSLGPCVPTWTAAGAVWVSWRGQGRSPQGGGTRAAAPGRSQQLANNGPQRLVQDHQLNRRDPKISPLNTHPHPAPPTAWHHQLPDGSGRPADQIQAGGSPGPCRRTAGRTRGCARVP